MSPSRDERRRDLERALAAAPGDSTARLGLARELARAGRKREAIEHVERVLRDEPLSASALETLDAVSGGPLANASPWPTVHGGNDRARRSSQPGARKGKLERRLRVGAPAGKLGAGEVECAESLTVGGDGAAYIATNHRRLVALDLASGQARWIREFEHAFAAPTVGAGERLVLPMLDSVRLLDGRTGETLWIARAPGVTGDAVPANATFASRGLVLCPGLRGALYALDAATGKMRWSFATRGAQYSAPAVDGERIFVACSFGELHALDLDGKRLDTVRVKYPGGVLPLMPVALAGSVLLSRLYLEPGVVFVASRSNDGFEGEPRAVKPHGFATLRVTGALDARRVLATFPDVASVSPEGWRELDGWKGLATEPITVTDSAGCVFSPLGADLDRPALAWFDASGALVKRIPGVHAGLAVVGPESVLVCSRELGIVQVVE